LASFGGHASTVRMLVSKFEAKLVARDIKEASALHLACLNGHKKVVDVLVNEYHCNQESTDIKKINTSSLCMPE